MGIFSTRLWPIEMKVGPGVVTAMGLQAANVLFGLSYGYEANGNVTQMNRYIQATPGAGSLLRACNYAYDTLNRLSEFTYDQTNHYHYVLDEYGNLLAEQKVSGGTGSPKGMAMPVDVNTNRLAGKPYDNLGNQVTTESGTATLNLAYWDQGHVARVWGGATGKTYHYYYDAEGKRRLKLVRADGTQAALGWTVSCYEGEDLACEQDQGDRVQDDTTYASKFLLTDHLGTTRAELRIDAAGQPSVTKPTDTMPYGELIDPPASSPDPVLFTGKQRDPESNLDFFGARFYISTLGRWNSADLSEKERIEDPQNWNRYNFCANNPLKYTDPDGLTERTFWESFKGSVLYASAVMAWESGVRSRYNAVVRSLPSTASAERTKAKYSARAQSTVFGKTFAEWMRPAARESLRVGGTANKTNTSVNKVCEVGGTAGKGILILGVATSVYNVATAPEGQKAETAAKEGGAWAGALSFGEVGSLAGAEVGALFSPVGSLVGAVAGGLVGAALGAIAGCELVDEVINGDSSGTINFMANSAIPILPLGM